MHYHNQNPRKIVHVPPSTRRANLRRMNARTPTKPLDIARKAPRMRPALRQAIGLIVEEGKTQRAAAEAVGMNETSLGRALARPAIREYVENQKALITLEADKIKARGRSLALLVGLDLLHNAKSEAVKARMVEFFAGEPKSGPSVNVQINQNAANGYEYARPGQVVEIIDAKPVSPDRQSGAQSSQGTDE